MSQQTLLGIFACAAITATTSAAPITITNPGFEDLYFGGNLPDAFGGDVPATAFPVGAAPNGWSAWGAVGNGASIGVLNPGTVTEDPRATFFPAGAAEADNVALLYFNSYQGGNAFGIEQTLAESLQPNHVYTLSADVGNIASGISSVPFFESFGFFDLRGFPGYRVELLAGEMVLGQDDNSLAPAEGEFERSTIQVSVGADHPAVGEPLAIRLINLNQQDVDDTTVTGLEVDFDAVQLEGFLAPPGDANRDLQVDGADFNIWNAYKNQSGTDWSQGDFNGDQTTDAIDLQIWMDHRFTSIGSPSSTVVPEPGSGTLACLTAFAAWGIFASPRGLNRRMRCPKNDPLCAGCA